jgi:FtsP/CotA-like multicopper oxidase with cupredoxin domain
MRTMLDMGMAGMGGMNMAGMDGMKKSDMPAAGRNDMRDMAGMDMSGGSKAAVPSTQEHNTPSSNKSMAGMNMGEQTGAVPFPQPGPNTMPPMLAPDNGAEEAKLRPSNPVHMHVGPQVDMVSMNVTERLNDPGDGLNDNGRRVLTYADLRARYRGTDGRPPTREVELHLSGNMERYIWGFNGKKFSSSEPIALKLGERVRIVLINDTMMEHPIHLHGLWSELENGHGEFSPYKHTVIVKPSERVSYLVSADTPGRWAYHCHLLYHMEAGMFRTVVVS